MACHVLYELSKPNEWQYLPTDKNLADIVSYGLASEKWCKGHAWLCDSTVVESDVFWPHEILRDHLVSDFDSRTSRATNINTLLVRVDQYLTNIDHLLNHYFPLLCLTHMVAWIKWAVQGLRW